MSRILMLGTGNGLVFNLNNTCFLLENNDDYFLVDTGGGVKTLENLDKLNIGIDKIHDIFISHKHNDHLLGLSWLLKKMMVLRKKGKYNGFLNIYCNDEVADAVDHLLKSVNDEKHLSMMYDLVNLVIVKDNDSKEIINNNFTFFDTKSREVKLFGFSVIFNNKRITFLGDVPYNEYNLDYVKDADYVLHEAFCLDSEESIFNAYEKHHSTVKSACESLNNLNIKNLLLFHTEETRLNNRKELYYNEAKQYFDGNVIVPDDLEIVDV